MSFEVIGVDHIYLAVSDFRRSETFYDSLMKPLGFKKGTGKVAGEPHCHYYNREFAISIRPARPQTPAHNPYAPGLHHLCLRVTDNASVDEAARILRSLGISFEGPRLCPEYDADYYALFFTDPDGMRLEIMNHIERRKTVRARWDRLVNFENPLDKLKERERGG
jgi:glyoxylase I family protein